MPSGSLFLADQAIPELGLSPLASHVHGVVHGSSASKIAFLFKNIGHSHGLTAAVSIMSFVIIMVFRTLKREDATSIPKCGIFPGPLSCCGSFGNPHLEVSDGISKALRC